MLVADSRPPASISRKKTANRRVSRTNWFTGGADRDRTDDLMTASHALSQLSYSPENVKGQNTKYIKGCQHLFAGIRDGTIGYVSGKVPILTGACLESVDKTAMEK